MWAQILCYKNQGIHWYHCNPTFLWQINFTLVRRLISALIWDISRLWNRSDGQDFREKRIDISRFLALYIANKVCGYKYVLSYGDEWCSMSKLTCKIKINLLITTSISTSYILTSNVSIYLLDCDIYFIVRENHTCSV